jgi:hypothetical protein
MTISDGRAQREPGREQLLEGSAVSLLAIGAVVAEGHREISMVWTINEIHCRGSRIRD